MCLRKAVGTDRNISKPSPNNGGMTWDIHCQLVNSEGGATTNNRGLDKGDWGLKPKNIESARACLKKKSWGVTKRYVAKTKKHRDLNNNNRLETPEEMGMSTSDAQL